MFFSSMVFLTKQKKTQQKQQQQQRLQFKTNERSEFYPFVSFKIFLSILT